MATAVTPFRDDCDSANSYSHMGQISKLAETCIAQEGHSLVFSAMNAVF